MADKSSKHGLALFLLAGAQFMVILDATIVNVALPSIEKALHFTNAAQLQWIVTGYTLTFGGFLLLGGRLADLFGRRRMFLTGIALFSFASLLGGLAQNPGMLIGFRALQGLGAALLSPAALSLILSIFREGKERNRAMGVWSGVAAGGGAVGLLLGGVLTQYANWRWIFFINVPVGILIAFLSLRGVPKILPGKKSSLDVLGAITVTGGLMALVYALVKVTDYGWSDHRTVEMLALSAALLVVFVINEMKVKHPLVPLQIFRNRNVSVGNIMQLPIAAGMFSVFFYLSIYQQQILGFSPTVAGSLNLPFALFIAISAGFASRKIAKIRPKVFLSIGPLLTASGLYYFSRIPVAGHYLTDIFPGIFLMATGMGMTFVALTLVATSGVKHEESGLVSGLLNTSQQIGGALGLAILTVISTSYTKSALVAAHGNQAVLPAALVGGFSRAFIVAMFFAISASIIAMIGLKNTKLTPDEIAHETETEGETFPAVPGV